LFPFRFIWAHYQGGSGYRVNTPAKIFLLFYKMRQKRDDYKLFRYGKLWESSRTRKKLPQNPPLTHKLLQPLGGFSGVRVTITVIMKNFD